MEMHMIGRNIILLQEDREVKVQFFWSFQVQLVPTLL